MEKNMDTESQPSVSSECNITSDVHTKEDVHNENKSESTDEQQTCAESSYQGLVDKDERLCSPVTPAAPLHFDETTVVDLKKRESNEDSLADNSISEVCYDNNFMISYDKAATSDDMNMNTEVTENPSKEIDEEALESDKDRTIQSLKEEVRSKTI